MQEYQFFNTPIQVTIVLTWYRTVSKLFKIYSLRDKRKPFISIILRVDTLDQQTLHFY